MNNAIEKQTEQYTEKRHQRKRWQKVVTALAAVAVFCTTYALILPAITWNRTLVCELPEHTHDESCYELVTVPAGKELICTETEHTHDDACYERGELICTLPESEGHVHGEGCYERGALVCTAAEHVHGEGCYTEVPEHEEKVLRCELTEHTHGDACYDAPPAYDDGYYCGQIAHKHSAEQGCYYADGTLKCTIPEHEHALLCQSDTSRVETRDQWVASYAEALPLTGDWAKDVIAIANTQIGYHESEVNFTVAEDGMTKMGYTRYGDWYGDKYGNWCAMFCAFCLRNAGVDESAMPVDSACVRWIPKLTDCGLYHTVDSGYVPKAGDLVFFDTTKSGHGANHVGLVSVGGSGSISTIEGNVGTAVCAMQRSAADGILGYGELPTNPIYINKENESKTIESAPASDGTIATVTGILPEGVWVELKSVELTEDDITAAFGENAKIKSPVAYDAALYKDGAAWSPEKIVSVSLKREGIADKVLAVLNAENKAENVSVRSEADSLSFETAAIGRVILYTEPPRMMTMGAPLRSGTPYSAGSIIVVPPDEAGVQAVPWPEAGADPWEYDLQHDTTGMFNLVYVPNVGQGGTNRTVLVVSWPEYGTKRTSCAATPGENGVKTVIFPDSHTAIIELEDYKDSQCTYGFSIATATLTNTQAARWIDGGDMTTAYTATEYQLNEGVTLTSSTTLAQLQENAVAYATFSSAPMVPKAYDTVNITTLNNYSVSTPAQPNFFNAYLTKLSNWPYAPASFYSTPRSFGLRWDIPTVHNNESSLLEIKKIRIYVPDEKLKLQSKKSGASDTLTESSFNQFWTTGWTIGARQFDAEKNAYYYEITPSSRWFNIGVSGSLTSRYYGFYPVFQLVDTAQPLPSSSTGTISYQAEDTVIYYKLPGDAEDSDLHTFTQTGPEIIAYKKPDVYNPSTAYNQNRFKNRSSQTDLDVVVGSAHLNEAFTYFDNNCIYRENVEYAPTVKGPITMHYEFPYAIRPSRILLTTGEHYYSATIVHNEAVLSSITYQTEDGSSHSASAAEISSINASLAVQNASKTVSFSFSEATEDNRVVSVDVAWDKLYQDYYCSGNGYGRTSNDSSTGNITGTDSIYLQTSFDYTVAEDAMENDETIDGQNRVQVKYDLIYDGTHHTSDNWLWFRLIPEKCPYLKGAWGSTSNITYAPDNRTQSNIGSISIYVGSYGEYRDAVKNPVIDLKAGFFSSKKISAGNNTNFANNDALALFTGQFTADPKLSGWEFNYTTLLHPEGKSWPVPEMTAATTVQISLEEGDYFKTLSLHYDGTLYLPHTGPDDTRTEYVLMSNIQIRRLDTDPFTGAKLKTSTNYAYTYYFLYGYLHMDGCTCTNHIHTSANGQVIRDSGNDYRGQQLPKATMITSREYSIFYRGNASSHPDLNVSQGQNVTVNIRPSIDFNYGGNTPSGNTTTYYDVMQYRSDTGTSSGSGATLYLPFDIKYPIYVELTDDDFTVDLEHTIYNGAAANSGLVDVSEIEVNGHRFLKMQFADGVLQKSPNAADFNYTSAPGYLRLGYASGNITGTTQIGFTALPGAAIGEHYPVGRVYYDYSELLEKYDGPRVTGYDMNLTNIKLNSQVTSWDALVEDEYDLTSSTTTETEKLFMADFSQGSSSPQKVNVTIAAVTGADGFPGRDGIYNVTDRVTNFTEPDTEKLNGLIIIKGAEDNIINDFVTCVELPRQDVGVDYIDVTGSTATAVSDITLSLRGPATVRSHNGVADEDLHIEYTTDGSSYVSAETIGDGWASVIGIRITADEIAPRGSIQLDLDLHTGKKATLDIKKAYMGGSFTYDLQSMTGEGLLGLSTWNYNNIPVTGATGGILFWDTYNENGTKSTGTDNAGKCETGISGILVTLYDAAGNCIDSDTTVSSGKFTLESWTSDKDQYIVIGEPTVSGVTVKLTKNSTADFYKNQYDSDFDRNAEGTTHTLVLPELPATGYNNIGAGFVKLPVFDAEDISVLVGNTVDLGAQLTYYLGMALPSTSYNITFEEADDDSIADVEATTKVKTTTTTYGNSNARPISDSTTVTGVSAGTTTVRIYTVTAAGDTIEKTVNITVVEPTLTVTKEVTGLAECSVAFPFTAQIVDGAFDTPADGAGYTVDGDGVAHFSLANGQSVGLRVGAGDAVIVTETGHDGFYVKFSESTWVQSGDTQTIENAAGRSVLVTNTAGAALPITGGIGAESLYALGLLLILGSLTCLIVLAKRKEE